MSSSMKGATAGPNKSAKDQKAQYRRHKKGGKRKLSVWIRTENHNKLQILKQITGEDLGDMAAEGIEMFIEKNAQRIANLIADLAKVR